VDFEDRRHHRGRRHHDDLNNIARVKLSMARRVQMSILSGLNNVNKSLGCIIFHMSVE
jgi:hypothetical protein